MIRYPITYVALGDSTAVGVGARNGGYPRRLEERLRAGGEVRLINLGQSGATSSEVAQSQAGRVNALAPDLVTLAVGVNDVWRMVPDAQFEANLISIARQLGALCAKVFVNNLPDMSHAPAAKLASDYLGIKPELLRERIQRLNHYFSVFAVYPNITVVNTHGLSRAALPGREELFSPDGFHPSDAGYDEWARLLWGELESAGLVQRRPS